MPDNPKSLAAGRTISSRFRDTWLWGLLCAPLLAGELSCAGGPDGVERDLRVAETVKVDSVWAGHPVGFTLLTHGSRQYVAFYDQERWMKVGMRALASSWWRSVRLPQTIGWDSHNSIRLAIDGEGHLHLAGNMHAVPLVYFRTTAPGDIETFERVPIMVGTDEERCTYPRFLKGSGGKLIFTYRSGSSGSGDQIYNVYDTKTKTWSRLLDSPLTSGEGKMNAYFHGPLRGPDGAFHLAWVWRDTPDCATNHDLSYARSRNLRDWQTSGGKALALPITLAACDIVDPVPPGGGLINGNAVIGFDAEGRPVISYHKYDANGKTQIYNARREGGKWNIRRVTDWDYRWEFRGGGSIAVEIRVHPVKVDSAGRLTQEFRHQRYGRGLWVLDPETLQPTETLRARKSLPVSLSTVRSPFPGMQVRWCEDSGTTEESGARYILRWETLPPNRDRPRDGDPPPPSDLTLYKIVEGASAE